MIKLCVNKTFLATSDEELDPLNECVLA